MFCFLPIVQFASNRKHSAEWLFNNVMKKEVILWTRALLYFFLIVLYTYFLAI